MAAPLTEAAIAKMREMIARGELEPGARLPPEGDLAHLLGASRNTVREAVRALVTVHVLDVRRGDGTYVTSLRPELLLEGFGAAVELMQEGFSLELIGVRRILEPAATALAAERIDDEALATLGGYLQRMRDAASEAERIEHDAEFHRLDRGQVGERDAGLDAQCRLESDAPGPRLAGRRRGGRRSADGRPAPGHPRRADRARPEPGGIGRARPCRDDRGLVPPGGRRSPVAPGRARRGRPRPSRQERPARDDDRSDPDRCPPALLGHRERSLRMADAGGRRRSTGPSRRTTCEPELGPAGIDATVLVQTVDDAGRHRLDARGRRPPPVRRRGRRLGAARRCPRRRSRPGCAPASAAPRDPSPHPPRARSGVAPARRRRRWPGRAGAARPHLRRRGRLPGPPPARARRRGPTSRPDVRHRPPRETTVPLRRLGHVARPASSRGRRGRTSSPSCPGSTRPPDPAGPGRRSVRPSRPRSRHSDPIA